MTKAIPVCIFDEVYNYSIVPGINWAKGKASLLVQLSHLALTRVLVVLFVAYVVYPFVIVENCVVLLQYTGQGSCRSCQCIEEGTHKLICASYKIGRRERGVR